MAALILPRRLQSHPGRPLELDLNNPFGVTAIGLHGFAATRSGIILPTVSTSILDDSSPVGPAYTQPSSANTQVTYGDLADWRPEFPFTVMMGFAPSSDSATSQFATASDGNTNMAGWSLITTSATTNFKLTLRLGDNAGVVVGNRSDFNHSTRITLNSRHIGGAIARSITDADVVLDDAFETPARGGSASSMVYGSGPAGFGARTTQALCPGTYDFLLIANRALSRDEWYALAANPYQVLRAAPRRIYFDVGAGGGPIEMTLTATATGSASFARAVQAIRSASATSAAVAQRLIHIQRSASSTATAGYSRHVSLSRSATATGSAVLEAIKTIGRTLSASAAGSASVSRVIDMARSASVAGAASMSRVVAITKTAASSASAALSRLIDKAVLSASSTGSATLTTATAITMTLTAVASGSAVMAMAFGLVLLASVTGTATYSRAISMLRATSSSAVASVVRGMSRTLSAVATAVAALTKLASSAGSSLMRMLNIGAESRVHAPNAENRRHPISAENRIRPLDAEDRDLTE